MPASVSSTEQSVALSNITAKYRLFLDNPQCCQQTVHTWHRWHTHRTRCRSFFCNARSGWNFVNAISSLIHNCVSRVKINDEIVLGTFRFFGPLHIQSPWQQPCVIQADVTTLAMSAATGVLCQGFLFVAKSVLSGKCGFSMQKNTRHQLLLAIIFQPVEIA